MRRPAIFIDRDGVIVDTLDYLSRPEQVTLFPGVARAIASVNRAAVPLIAITNQSGIARGLLTEHDLGTVHARLEEMLAAESAHIDAIYHCPHHPDVGEGHYRQACACRKPAPGMVLAAASDLDIDLANSILIGDQATDIEAGKRAGIGRTFLVRTGHGRRLPENLEEISSCPSAVYADAEAALEAALDILRPGSR